MFINSMDHKPNDLLQNDPIWPPAPTPPSYPLPASERRRWLTSETVVGLIWGVFGYVLALIGTIVLFSALVFLMASPQYAAYPSFVNFVRIVKNAIWDYQRFIALTPLLLACGLLRQRNPSLAVSILVGCLAGMLLLWLLFPPHFLLP